MTPQKIQKETGQRHLCEVSGRTRNSEVTSEFPQVVLALASVSSGLKPSSFFKQKSLISVQQADRITVFINDFQLENCIFLKNLFCLP